MGCNILRNEFRLIQFRLLYPNSADFAKSPWFGVLFVLLYRFAIAVFCICVTIWSGFFYRDTGVKWFIYLTNWSFLCVTLYFIGATIVTALHYNIQRKQHKHTASNPNENDSNVQMSATKSRDNEKSSIARDQSGTLVTTPDDVQSEVGPAGYTFGASRNHPMRWFHQAVWGIYNIASVAAILVTISFWSLIYASFGGGETPVSVIFHAVNSVLMVADTMLSSIPVRLLHFVYPILYSTAYIVFTVIYWACGGTGSSGRTYIYPQTDYTRPAFSAVSLVCLVLIAVPLCQGLVFCLYCLRAWVNTKCHEKVQS